MSFLFGIGLSLCANIAAAPELKPLAVAVAACPPLSLLLAVELFNRTLKRHRVERTDINSETGVETDLFHVETNPTNDETDIPTGATGYGTAPHPPGNGRDHSQDAPVVGLADRPATAEQRMWEHYWRERAAGHCPTGADLDRIAGTNNYGRRVLRRWRAQALLPPAARQPPGERRSLRDPGNIAYDLNESISV